MKDIFALMNEPPLTLDTELNLIRGLDFQITDKLVIKHPTLLEIIEYGEANYNASVRLFTTKPYDYMVEIDDAGLDYETVDEFDLFLQFYRENKASAKFFLGELEFEELHNRDTGEKILRAKCGAEINKQVYRSIANHIRRINFISDEEEFHPGNEGAKKEIISQERKRKQRLARKPPKAQSSRLSNLVSASIWCMKSQYNYSNVWTLSIYQFYEGIFRTKVYDKYKNTMLGVYTGNVDTSKLDFKEIDWMGDIKN